MEQPPDIPPPEQQEIPPRLEDPDLPTDSIKNGKEIQEQTNPPKDDGRPRDLLRRVEKYEKVSLVILTAVIAVFTVVLAVSTFFLWRATQDLVHGAEDTAQRQLRAYVSVIAVQLFHFGTDEAVIGGLEIVNNGQTPAYKINASINVGTERTKSSVAQSEISLDPKAKVYLWGVAERPLKPDEYDAVVKGTASIYVYGEIRYADAFGKSHVSRFRYTYNCNGVAPPSGDSLTVTTAPEGNESD